jgi:transcription antitermination factor NusG
MKKDNKKRLEEENQLTEEEKVYKYKNGWFVCAVTVTQEMKVYNELKKLLASEYWGQYILDMFLPMEMTLDKKGELKRTIVPAYKGVIFIKMVLTQEVYGAIKIEGFRMPFPPKDPRPISEKEMEKVLKYKMNDEENSI